MARSEKHAVVYFNPAQGEPMVELAKRLRASGARTTLIWSSNFSGAKDLQPEARAVLIQKGCRNAAMIEETYRKLAHDVELHYVDSDGEFIDQEEIADESSGEVREDVEEAHPPVESEILDADGSSVEATPDIVPTDYGHDIGEGATEADVRSTDSSEPDSDRMES
jgi:hypothetical protein